MSIDATCIVTQIMSKRTAVAVVQDFEPQIKLHLILNKEIKLSMVWNGTAYEGRGAGMDFISAGPTVNKITRW